MVVDAFDVGCTEDKVGIDFVVKGGSYLSFPDKRMVLPAMDPSLERSKSVC